VRFAKALEFQVRLPAPVELFEVRVVTPGMLPNRVVAEPVVALVIRVPVVVPGKFLLLDEFMPKDVE
jgi:hypothetical protein